MRESSKVVTEFKDHIYRNGLVKLGAVGTTMGPYGKTIGYIDDTGRPHITKDGVTLVNRIKASDELSELAIKTVLQSSNRLLEEAGDGTTSAIINSIALYKDLADGKNTADVDIVLDELSNFVKPLTPELLENLIHTSTNGDKEVVDLIKSCYKTINNRIMPTYVNVKKSTVGAMSVEEEIGFKMDKGLLKPFMINTPLRGTYEKEIVKLVIVDKLNIEDLKTHISNNFDVIICLEYEAGVLEIMEALKREKRIKTVIYKIPGFGSFKQGLIDDLKVYLDAGNIGDNEYNCGKITISSDTCIIEHISRSEIADKHIDELSALAANAKDGYERKNLEKRLSCINGRVVTLYVTAYTPAELKERMDRVDDAIGAINAAITQGVVPGSGIVYAKVANALSSRYPELHFDYLYTNIRTILSNKDSSLEVNNVMDMISSSKDNDDTICYDTLTLVNLGAIDPYPVAAGVIKAAISVATTLNSMGGIIVNE